MIQPPYNKQFDFTDLRNSNKNGIHNAYGKMNNEQQRGFMLTVIATRLDIISRHIDSAIDSSRPQSLGPDRQKKKNKNTCNTKKITLFLHTVISRLRLGECARTPLSRHNTRNRFPERTAAGFIPFSY